MKDLHLHLEGSLSPEGFYGIAKETGLSVPNDLESRIKINPSSNSFQSGDAIKSCLELPLSFTQTPDNVRYAVMKLCETLSAENTEYAEIRLTPLLHTLKGYTQEEILLGAIEALQYASFLRVNVGFILCLRRGAKDAENRITLELAEKHLGKGVCGFDLCKAYADDSGFTVKDSIEEYSDFLSYGSKHNIPFTVHTYIEGGTDEIWKALRLGAKRIGHGLSAANDNELVKHLVSHNIPLELCPTEEYITGEFNHNSSYPLKALTDAGVTCTVNTGFRTVFDTNLPKEYAFIRSLEGITDRTVLKLKHNSDISVFM